MSVKKWVRDFVIDKHEGQKYGQHDYIYHLDGVFKTYQKVFSSNGQPMTMTKNWLFIVTIFLKTQTLLKTSCKTLLE